MAVRPPAMPKNSGQCLAPLVEVEGLDHDGQCGREHQCATEPLDEPEGNDPRLGGPPVGVRPHSADDPAKTMTPKTTIFLWPIVSARRPPKAKNEANDSR